MNNELVKTGRGADEVVQYDPERGLKSIAVAEAAENYYARAKDATGLYKAIEAKLGAQRQFVIWWDGQGLNQPGSPILTDRQGLRAGQDGIPDSTTIHRWRKRLKETTKFDAALATAHERCIKVSASAP